MEILARLLNRLLNQMSNWAWPALLLSLTFSLGIIAYAIPRGLDITDESVYVLLAQPEPDIKLSVIHTQWLFQQINWITNMSFGYRQLRGSRLLISFGAFAILAYTLYRERRKDKKTIWLIGGAALSLLLFAGNGRIMSLGYNSLNWTWGALLLAAAIQWTRPSKAIWTAVAMGLLLFLMWITKFTSAMLLGGLVLVLLPAWVKMPMNKWARSMAVALICFAASLFLAQSEGHPISPLDFWSNVNAETTGSHAAGSLLQKNLLEFATFYGPLLPVLILGMWSRIRAHEMGVLIRFLLPMATLGLAILDLMTLRQFNAGYWMLLGGLAVWNSVQCTDRRRQTVGALLLLAPAALITGTDVGWEGHLLPLSGFALLSAALTATDRSSWLATLAIPLILLPELVLHPYRQAPLAQCTETIDITKTGENLKVSPILFAYLSETRRIAERFPFPLIGTDRNCGEAMMTSAPIEGELLWSLESWNTRHAQSWTQHDTLLLALCNTNNQEFLQAQLPAHQWTFVDKVDRRPLLKEMGRYGWGIPEQNAFAVYYLLTRSNDR
ncbi:hypothetical protein N9L83_03260 [Flavobacteriales bacterium]|nr:hypothetical protein [Flavobacteriales bacterium]